MNAPNDMSNYPYEQPFSFASWLNGWFVKIKKVISANFKIVLMVVCVGAALGLAYSIFKPVRYNAEITFSVEDSKSIGGGLLFVMVAFGVVLFRLIPQTPEEAARVALAALRSGIPWAGRFSVVTKERIRSTPLPDMR